jgi:hypothetical protein
MRFLPPNGLENPTKIVKEYKIDDRQTLFITGDTFDGMLKWSASWVIITLRSSETFLVQTKIGSRWLENDGDWFDSEEELINALSGAR